MSAQSIITDTAHSIIVPNQIKEQLKIIKNLNTGITQQKKQSSFHY